ncbi:hypothetical protein [Zymobacter palmae]|uniref:hypothetical protein n=1 Tax=Zymobacter palmae TaxID=33074 RepID=UPI0004810D10|nr:hypothetical protein [Zymobacter palmae]
MIEFNIFQEWRPISARLKSQFEQAINLPDEEVREACVVATQDAITAIAYRSFSIHLSNTFSNALTVFSPEEAVVYYLSEKTGFTLKDVSESSERSRHLLLKDELLVEAIKILKASSELLIHDVGNRFYRDTVSQILESDSSRADYQGW